MSLSPDGVANAVLSVYRCFPKNGKPSTRKGEPEWTVLAGIVLSSLSDDQSRVYECVALGTGLRALPYAKLSPHGDLLHDAHAEVLARRSFKLWLIRMLRRSKETGELDSRFQVRDAYVHVRKDVKIVLYVSTLPCGDASMGSLARASESAAVSEELYASTVTAIGPHTMQSSRTVQASNEPIVYRGRISYDTVSILRTKPGRRDSPPTTSHSCSDKIASWCYTGLEGALLSRLGFGTIRLDALVFGGVAFQDRQAVSTELERAIWTRMGDLVQDLPKPDIMFTDERFEHERSPNALSAYDVLTWCRGLPTEVLMPNLVRQGNALKRIDDQPLSNTARFSCICDQLLSKLTQARDRSRLSKLSLFEEARAVLALEGNEPTGSYSDFKQAAGEYQEKKKRLREGPFNGWLVKGALFEAFRARGA